MPRRKRDCELNECEAVRGELVAASRDQWIEAPALPHRDPGALAHIANACAIVGIILAGLPAASWPVTAAVRVANGDAHGPDRYGCAGALLCSGTRSCAKP